MAHTLTVIRRARLQRNFRFKLDDVAQPWSAYGFAATARQKEKFDADVVLDLTPYLTVATDVTTLVLDVPADVTAALPVVRDTAAWDLFAWPIDSPAEAFLVVEGSFELDESTTPYEVQ